MNILIDENLPETLSCWQVDGIIHVRNLGNKVSDNDIWEYSHKNNLLIVTKDSDFSNRILTSTPPPRVVHLRIGNMRFQAMEKFISQHWEEILRLSASYKLVNVYIDLIEGIN